MDREGLLVGRNTSVYEGEASAPPYQSVKRDAPRVPQTEMNYPAQHQDIILSGQVLDGCCSNGETCTLRCTDGVLEMQTEVPGACARGISRTVMLSDIASAEVYRGHKRPGVVLFLLGLALLAIGSSLLGVVAADSCRYPEDNPDPYQNYDDDDCGSRIDPFWYMVTTGMMVLGQLLMLPAFVRWCKMWCGSRSRITVSFYEKHRVGFGPFRCAPWRSYAPPVIEFVYGSSVTKADADRFVGVVLSRARSARREAWTSGGAYA